MAASDARPIPRKNVAFRCTFPILDSDGDLVTAAATLDSEVSKDGGTFADATSEATEIATSSGMYFLDLTATEMNADTVAIIVKTSTAGAKTTPIVLYPEESGDLRVNVDSLTAGAIAAASFAAGAIDAAALAADAGTEIADALLKRDMSAVTGEAARSPLNALRMLRNAWNTTETPGTLTVKKEDDSTVAWTATLSQTQSASPITGIDPA